LTCFAVGIYVSRLQSSTVEHQQQALIATNSLVIISSSGVTATLHFWQLGWISKHQKYGGVKKVSDRGGVG